MRYPALPSERPSADVATFDKAGQFKPMWLNTTVGRWACRYTRVANMYPHGYQQDGRRPTNFRISKESEISDNGPFSITTGEGILYVSNPEMLSQLKPLNVIELNIEWDLQPLEFDAEDITNISTRFRVDIVDSNQAETECDVGLYCAKFRTETGCNEATGSAATDQRGCAWRRSDSNNSLSSNGPSRMYQTCSPDLSTCPDGCLYASLTLACLAANGVQIVHAIYFDVPQVLRRTGGTRMGNMPSRLHRYGETLTLLLNLL